MSDVSPSNQHHDDGNAAAPIFIYDDHDDAAAADADNDNDMMRSAVWTFFKKVFKTDSDAPVGEVICNLCHQTLKYNQQTASTSNMRKHLMSQHEDNGEVKLAGILPAVGSTNKKRKSSAASSSATGDMRRYVTTRHYVSPTLEKELALSILKITCEMNLSFRALSTGVHFQQMMSKLVSGYQVPSYQRLRSLLDVHYADIMNKLIAHLKNIDSIALTTDATVLSGQGLPYAESIEECRISI
jgi:hypothetical protein